MENIKNNKSAIVISYAREIDMFLELIYQDKEAVCLLVNDLKTSVKEKKSGLGAIVDALTDRGFDYALASDELINKSVYGICYSSGALTEEKVSWTRYLGHLYAQTLGELIKALGLGNYTFPLLRKRLTGESFKNNYFKNENVEYKLSNKCVFLPTGLDLTMHSFPLKRWERSFQAFFCHSKLDQELIREKFPEKETYVVGYPRFSRYDTQSAKAKLNTEFELNVEKKTVVWLPTNVKTLGEFLGNIEPWLDQVLQLRDEFNLLVRPHPKTLSTKPEYATRLKDLGFLVDSNADQDFEMLVRGADLVLADYGDPIMCAVYVGTPLVILNMSPGAKYGQGQKNAGSLCTKAREFIPNFYPGEAKFIGSNFIRGEFGDLMTARDRAYSVFFESSSERSKGHSSCWPTEVFFNK
jgi:hypothetical protein